MRRMIAIVSFQRLIFNLQLIYFSCQPLYLHFQNANLLVPIISYKLKVLWISVIPFIFFTTRRVSCVFMMHYLPIVKASTYCLCYYKTMFKNITILFSHWIKEVIGENFNLNIVTLFYSATFPIVIFATSFSFRRTRVTSQPSWFALSKLSPSFLSAIYASSPDKSTIAFPMMSFNITQLRHISIIPYLPRNLKGYCNA